MLGSNGFDWFALTCSMLFFIFFAASMGCMVSGQCTSDGMYGLNLMKLITLIPAIIFFAKLLKDSVTTGSAFNISRFQLGMLLTYFLFVFIFLCANLAGDATTAANVNTLCLFILPLFIIASFYNTYEMWTGSKTNNMPRHMIYLSLSLSVLYYCLFYFSLQAGGGVFGQMGNSTVNGVLIAVSVLLILQFAYAACMKWKTADLKNKSGFSMLNKPIDFYVNTINKITRT